jgi:hydrogenase/urease accessory protein HupE
MRARAHENRPSKILAVLLTLVVLAGVPRAARAHPIDVSLAAIRIDPDKLVITFSFNLRELQDAFKLDANGDHVITRDEVVQKGGEIQKFLEEHVTLALSYTPSDLGKRLPVTLPVDFDEIPERTWPFAQVQFAFEREIKGLPPSVALRTDFAERFSPKHTTLVVIVQGRRREEFVLKAGEPSLRYDTGRETTLGAQMAEFIRLGMEHIFNGYDHLLFLLALVVVGANFVQLVKIVTSFTVAHSITLILAALEIVKLPTRLVESCIALTIVYVAAENLWAKKTGHRWVLTFFFGFVHGFGFANALRDLGLPPRGMIASLLSFNLGVEIGQLCVVAVLFPAVLWLNKQRFGKKVDVVVSAIVCLFGAAWFVERAFALSFMPF